MEVVVQLLFTLAVTMPSLKIQDEYATVYIITRGSVNLTGCTHMYLSRT